MSKTKQTLPNKLDPNRRVHIITLKPDFEVYVVRYAHDTVKFSRHAKPPFFQLLFKHGSSSRRVPVLLERRHLKVIRQALRRLPNQTLTASLAYLIVAGCAVTHLKRF